VRNGLILAAAGVLLALFALACSSAGNVTTSPAASASVAAKPSSPGASPTPAAPVRGREGFAGSEACKPCHRAQSDAYFGSHHARAFVTPDAEPSKTRFDEQRLTSKLGGTSHFSLRSGAPVVTTPIAGGKLATFPVSYVSGVWPLEQYVVATERGKLQSLGAVWDSRGPEAGGGKWFHVYGKAGIAPNDPLFFSAPAQNWNHVCADCHSTWVERRYDVAADSFDTRWAETSVGCEACHGPGAAHVRSALAATSGHQPSPLPARLRLAEPWRFLVHRFWVVPGRKGCASAAPGQLRLGPVWATPQPAAERMRRQAK